MPKELVLRNSEMTRFTRNTTQRPLLYLPQIFVVEASSLRYLMKTRGHCGSESPALGCPAFRPGRKPEPGQRRPEAGGAVPPESPH